MPRSITRKIKPAKPLIVVFCEGESEQAYASFLKKKFSEYAVIKYPQDTGLFDKAKKVFDKEPKYKNNIDVTDEIWFFFDVELKNIGRWDEDYEIIQYLRRLRRKPNIKVRLLMTCGCIEYWLMLHYKMTAPPLQTTAEKDNMISQLEGIEPTYKKGDKVSTSKIAENYPTALVNGEKTLKNLSSQGLPELDDTDKRNAWLFKQCKTFSNVHEAINYLESIKSSGKSK